MPRTLDIIIEQTARIAGTIRQVLDLTRREPPRRSRANLGLLMESARELLAPLAQKKRIEIVVQAPEDASELVDANQIRQVIMNLVMNAIHAMEGPGQITLRLSPEPSSPHLNGHDLNGNDPSGQAAAGWVLSVEDQGPGIPEENLGKIFEPFFTTKPLGDGTGLGLSIVAGIVQEHGGTIGVESPPGRGATFTVRLPRAASPEEVS
jgi:signal transduction histidine kinase